MTKQYNMFQNNIKRVDSLCSVYESIKQNDLDDSKKEYKYTDVIRAAVVILHSSFENYYREIIINTIIKNKDPQIIKQYTLPSLKKASFSLDDLLSFSDMSVNELIEKSIKTSLAEVSFNNYSQIVSYATKANISLNGFNMQNDIDSLITRRHKIVHEADLKNNKLQSIKLDQFSKWKKAVENLVGIIDSQIVEE